MEGGGTIMMKKLAEAAAKAALKTGIKSANAACRSAFYQSKVPADMKKYQKH